MMSHEWKAPFERIRDQPGFPVEVVSTVTGNLSAQKTLTRFRRKIRARGTTPLCFVEGGECLGPHDGRSDEFDSA